MPFPVTVSSVTQSAEAPGKYGPFLVGTDRYEILILSVLVDPISFIYQPYFVAMKSADAGATWNEVDSGGRPQAGNQTTQNQLTPYTSVQSATDPTKILSVYSNPSSALLSIIAFDAGTDTWGSSLSDSPWQIQGAFPFLSAVARADNSVLLFNTQGFYTDSSGEQHGFVKGIVYDIMGDSWGTPFDLGYSDYASVIGWNQVPCGIAVDAGGVAHVFMQQVTHAVPLTAQGFSTAFDNVVPWDCDTLDVEMWGDGGGGGAATNTQSGSGGTAGQFVSSSVSVTPGDTITAAVVGSGGAGGVFGGADGQSGTGTSYATLSATGGTGAANGSGSSGITGGGDGGGGSDTIYGTGSPGSAGVAYDGTNSGANGGNGGNPADGGTGLGGPGGSYFFGPPSFGDQGGIGNQPGGGGGGGGSAGASGGNGGDGGAGEAAASYIPVQGTVYSSRLWQQAVYPDGALGTLEEITDGAFPIQSFEDNLCLMPFDCVGGESEDSPPVGAIAITFSGANNTSGYDKVEVMQGEGTDPVTFSSQLITTGNSQDSSPCIAIDGSGNVFCAYKKISGATTFVYREDSGSGFGSEQTFGAFDDPFGRIQVAAFSSIPEITFGTPVGSVAQFTVVEGPNYLTATSTNPGVDAKRITVNLVSVQGGGTASVSIDTDDFNRFVVNVTVGWDFVGSFPPEPTTNIDWAAIAVIINAAASAILNAVGGSGNQQVPLFIGGQLALGLTGGGAGVGLSQYYSAGTVARVFNYVSAGGPLAGSGNYATP